MNKRLERATALLHQEVSRFLPTIITDKNYGLVTVSHVDLASDLSQAAVWVSLLGNNFPAESVISYLNHQARVVQTNINKSLYWRRTPKLVFRLDVSGDYVEHIASAIQELKSSDE